MLNARRIVSSTISNRCWGVRFRSSSENSARGSPCLWIVARGICRKVYRDEVRIASTTSER